MRLGYSKMTMGRAYDELLALDLAKPVTSGKERRIELVAAGKDFWERIQLHLVSPVKRTVILVEDLPEGNTLQAGFSALSHYTRLAGPARRAYAIPASRQIAKTLGSGLPREEVEQGNGCEVELWSYDPGLLTENGFVDRLSLFLCLRDDHDERVEQALKELVEGVSW
ncbi:MAG: hypothetical protein WCQ50_01540 [Spirochaetota bacterium]